MVRLVFHQEDEPPWGFHVTLTFMEGDADGEENHTAVFIQERELREFLADLEVLKKIDPVYGRLGSYAKNFSRERVESHPSFERWFGDYGGGKPFYWPVEEYSEVFMALQSVEIRYWGGVAILDDGTVRYTNSEPMWYIVTVQN